MTKITTIAEFFQEVLQYLVNDELFLSFFFFNNSYDFHLVKLLWTCEQTLVAHYLNPRILLMIPQNLYLQLQIPQNLYPQLQIPQNLYLRFQIPRNLNSHLEIPQNLYHRLLTSQNLYHQLHIPQNLYLQHHYPLHLQHHYYPLHLKPSPQNSLHLS